MTYSQLRLAPVSRHSTLQMGIARTVRSLSAKGFGPPFLPDPASSPSVQLSQQLRPAANVAAKRAPGDFSKNRMPGQPEIAKPRGNRWSGSGHLPGKQDRFHPGVQECARFAAAFRTDLEVQGQF